MKKSFTLYVYFIMTMSVYAVMLLITIPTLHIFTDGLNIFDIQPIFNRNEAIALLKNLGEAGRAYYLYPQLSLDMLYIGLFGVSYHHILRHFKNTIGIQNWKIIPYLPVIAALFDALENVSIFFILHSFPNISGIIDFVPYLTCLKLFFSILYLSTFFVLGYLVIKKKWLRRK